MNITEPVFAASLATAIAFITYYGVRNIFFYNWLRSSSNTVGNVETFIIGFIILLPALLSASFPNTGYWVYGVGVLAYFVGMTGGTALRIHYNTTKSSPNCTTWEVINQATTFKTCFDEIVVKINVVNGKVMVSYMPTPDSKEIPNDALTKFDVNTMWIEKVKNDKV